MDRQLRRDLLQTFQIILDIDKNEFFSMSDNETINKNLNLNKKNVDIELIMLLEIQMLLLFLPDITLLYNVL